MNSIKYIVILFALLLSTLNTFAQDKDSLIVSIDKKYVGIINTSGFDLNKTDVLSPSYSTDLRVGIRTKLAYANFTSFAQAVYTPSKTMAAFWTEYTPSKSLMFASGLMVRPITLIRSTPVSPGGQFEPGALGLIPGGSIGFMSRYTVSSTKLELGVYNKNSHPELNAAIAGDNFRVGAFYSSVNYGLAGNLKIGKFQMTCFWESDSLSSNNIVFSTGPLTWYSSVTYNYKSKEFRNNLEIGVGSPDFKLDYGMETSLWLGYTPKQKTLNLYIFVYIK